MSKAVKIPDYMKPNYVVTINGVRYSYPAGTTQVVPDCVASAIQHYYDSLPKEDPPETTEQMVRRICGEMIAANTVPKIALDLSEVELGEDPLDVTDQIPYDTAYKIILETPDVYRDSLYAATLCFEYDGTTYFTSTYYTTDDGEMHFIANQTSEGATTAILDVIITFDSNKKVYAKLIVNELTNE